MDGQLKRGLLDVCVLAAIKSKDSYGYQIIKDMKPYLVLSNRPSMAEIVALGSAQDQFMYSNQSIANSGANVQAVRPEVLVLP